MTQVVALYCSRMVGGCGGELTVIAHLRIQRALVEWFGGQGLPGTMEKVVGPGSRTRWRRART